MGKPGIHLSNTNQWEELRTTIYGVLRSRLYCSIRLGALFSTDNVPLAATAYTLDGRELYWEFSQSS